MSRLSKFGQNYLRYQNFSEESVTLDPKIYKDTIKDILDLVCERLNKKPKELRVLDAGCGAGGYAFEFAKHVKKIVGVEPDGRTYKLAIEIKKRKKIKNVFFNHNFIEDYKSREKFDLIISLATLEHMPNANKSFKQIFKLLKVGGFVYITAPNKLWWYDGHYQLPFILWLPLPLANLYVRIMSRGKSFEDASYHKTYWGVKKLFECFTSKYEFVLPDPNASYLACGYANTPYKIIKNIGIFLIKKFPIFWVFSKGFIVLAQK